MRIYLSSTWEDLKEHRAAAIAAIRSLHYDYVGMEDYGAEDAAPLERCLTDVASCDVYVGIFAWRYGSVPQGQSRSITELEYLCASGNGIPLLLFLSNPDASWPVKHIDADEAGRQIRALRKRLMEKKLVAFFDSPADLRAKLTSAIALHADIQCSHDAAKRPPKEASATGSVIGLRPADVSGSFKDREVQLEELRRLLQDDAVKLIGILGRGGMGKTALLSKVCHEVESGQLRLPAATGHMGADGILYCGHCRAATDSAVERILHGLAQLLDSRAADHLREEWHKPTMELGDKARTLFSRIGQRPFLVVLDNFEDFLDADSRVSDRDLALLLELALETSHGLRFVLTTRQLPALGTSGLRAARFVHIGVGLPESAAVALLRDLDPDGQFGLRNAAPDLLAKVARCSFGIPRALEIVAGLLASDPTLALDQLVADSHLFNGLVVENLVAEHYRRVTESEKRVLEALAVYGEAVPEVALNYLLKDFLPDLDVHARLRTLVRSYFVAHSRGSGTFRLHPLDQIQVYGNLKDGNSGWSRRALHRRAAAYYESIRPPTNPTDLVQIDSQLQARRHYVQAGLHDEAGEIAHRLVRPLTRWGYYAVLDQIVDDTIASSHGTVLATALIGKGEALSVRSQWTESLAFYERAVGVLECVPGAEAGLLTGIAKADMAYAHIRLAQFAKAVATCEDVLTTATSSGDRETQGRAFGMAALATTQTGQFDTALNYCTRALALLDAQAASHGTMSSHLVDIIGIIHLARGEHDMALDRFRQSYATRRSLRTRLGLGHSYHNIGLVRLAQGRPNQARLLLDRSMAIRTEIGHRRGQIETLRALGLVRRAEGRHRDAVETFEHALAMATAEEGATLEEARCLLELGIEQLATDATPAVDVLRRAEQIAARIEARPEMARAALGLAFGLERCGDLDNAQLEAAKAYDLVYQMRLGLDSDQVELLRRLNPNDRTR